MNKPNEHGVLQSTLIKQTPAFLKCSQSLIICIAIYLIVVLYMLCIPIAIWIPSLVKPYSLRLF